MADFRGIVPVIRDDMSIAQQILAHVAAMKQDGSFLEGASLCWDPAGLELLAMFAIAAKDDRERVDWLELPFTVAVHAAKKYDAVVRDALTEEPFRSTLKRCGFYPGDPRKLLQLGRTINGLQPVPLGAIVGTVEVWRVITTEEWTESRHGLHIWEEGERFDQEKAFGWYQPGRFAWLLRNHRMLEKPITFSGRQEALYLVDDRTQAQIDAQLGRVAA